MACNFSNFAYRFACKNCSAARREELLELSGAMLHFPPARPGDWYEEWYPQCDL